MGNLIIAKTFIDSSSKLEGHERGLVMTFLGKMNEDATRTGLNLEPVKQAKDKHVRSLRITQELRAICYKREEDLWLLYAGHHDDAYQWICNRTIEIHAVTKAFQIVVAPESVKLEPDTKPDNKKAQGLFDKHPDKYLLSLGLPETWLHPVRQIQSEDALLAVVGHLPPDVAERLIDLASGKVVTPPVPADKVTRPIDHPDTRQSFWVLEDGTDIGALLTKPIESWMAFLHPSQRKLVEGVYKGPVKVTGSAGTGKTVVALHRARHLARKGLRVLVSTYSNTLCRNLGRHLQHLCTDGERSRITVGTVHQQALAIVKRVKPDIQPAAFNAVPDLLEQYHRDISPAFDLAFLKSEWHAVINNHGLLTWDEYRDASRTGRGKPLNVKERKEIWRAVAWARERLTGRGEMDWQWLCREAHTLLADRRAESTFDAVVVDELQDLRPAEIRLLVALAARNPGHFMLVGDAGQRIYGGHFTLSKLGVETRGRSSILRLNYRTTEQIRKFADRLLGTDIDDFDGATESRKETRSMLRGPEPILKPFTTEDEEFTWIADEIAKSCAAGIEPGACAIFARSNKGLENARAALSDREIRYRLIKTDDDDTAGDSVILSTMHRAKGLEFKRVFVAGCNDRNLPHTQSLKDLTDPADRERQIAEERQLFYVSLTRARDAVFVTWSGKKSPFLE